MTERIPEKPDVIRATIAPFLSVTLIF